MLTEKGTLPVGLEKNGVFHRDFELRPGLVGDSIEVSDEREPKKLANRWYANLCLAAKQIVRIGEISPVTVEDLVKVFDIDMEQITLAQEKLAARLSRFHEDDEGSEQAGSSLDVPGARAESAQIGPGASEDEVHSGSGS